MTSNAAPNGPCSTVSNYEGQLKAQVLFNPQNMTLTARFVTSLIKATLARFGEVKAIQSIPSTVAHVKTYCIEFFDTRSAADACNVLNNKDIGVSRWAFAWSINVLKNLQHDISIKLEPNRDDAVEPYVESLSHRYVEQPSVTGRSTVPMNDPVYNSSSGYYGMPAARPALHPSGHGQTPNHNQVDIMRIRLGADVRTTVSS